jgi:DASH complex subunit DAD3
MSSPVPGSDIFHKNPYESHPSLSELESEVLWEYAKLAQYVKEVCITFYYYFHLHSRTKN